MSFTLLIVLGLTSCKDTYEFHEDYIADGEVIYATKVDSLFTLPGNQRLEITGFISNAFNVEEIIVYWNKGENSQTFPYSKSENDTDPIQLVVEGLEEQSYEFNVYSNVKQKMHDVAFGHDVLLALRSQPTGLAGTLFSVAGDVIHKRGRLGANKAFLKIRMDLAGRLGRRTADFHSPGAHFFFAGRKKCPQPEQFVTRTDHAIEAGFGQSHLIKEHLLVVGIE